jgi:hypothetical protein
LLLQAAAYNHRVHMDPSDMPAMHLCDVGGGINQLGYYMYHGGNNPHSVVHAGDAPEQTLQESGFQPAGAQNPMPSISYDFFAPLGEFGQPRRHYHQMRLLHLLVQGWGRDLAATTATPPLVVPSGAADNATLRWIVRANGTRGFVRPARAEPAISRACCLLTRRPYVRISLQVFVNNYQRLAALSPKNGVRFHLRWEGGGGAAPPPLSLPSNLSAPVDVLPASWFVWPFGTPLLEDAPTEGHGGGGGGGPVLAWATAQLVARVGDVMFLVETAGAVPELALNLHGATLEQHGGSASVEGPTTVLRGLAPGTSPVATVAVGARRVRVVLLPAAAAEAVWTVQLAGQRRLVLLESDALPAPPRDSSRAVSTHRADCNDRRFRPARRTTSYWPTAATTSASDRLPGPPAASHSACARRPPPCEPPPPRRRCRRRRMASLAHSSSTCPPRRCPR